MWLRLKEATAAQLRGVAAVLKGAEEVVPPEAEEEARLMARAGVPLDAITGAYRMAHALLWEAFLAAAEEAGVEGETRLALLTGASRRLFALVDEGIALATDAYLAERDRLQRSRELRRARAVRAVLAGAPDAALDWPLEATHLGVVAWSEAAEAALAPLAAGLGARVLVVQASDDATWGWLTARTLPERPPLPPVAGLALGAPAAGVDGFRRTHADAVAAQRVAWRSR